MENGRLIRDADGHLFHIPWGKADVESFAVWVPIGNEQRLVVFPGLVRRPDSEVRRPVGRVARA